MLQRLLQHIIFCLLWCLVCRWHTLSLSLIRISSKNFIFTVNRNLFELWRYYVPIIMMMTDIKRVDSMYCVFGTVLFSTLQASRKVLILGLEQSGKSALLSQLSKEGTDCSQYIPTKGFNVVCISFDKVDLNIWEGRNILFAVSSFSDRKFTVSFLSSICL